MFTGIAGFLLAHAISGGSMKYRQSANPIHASFQQTDHHIVWHRFCRAVRLGSAGLVGSLLGFCQRALAGHGSKTSGCIALATDAKHAQRHAVRANERLVFSGYQRRCSIARDAKAFTTERVQKRRGGRCGGSRSPRNAHSAERLKRRISWLRCISLNYAPAHPTGSLAGAW